MNLGSVQAVLDANGAARGSVGPQAAGHRWIVRRAVLRASGGSKPTARVYRDQEAVSAFVDGTRSADSNSADWPSLELFPGQTLLCVWSLGTPGASVALILEGEMESAYGVR